MTLDLVPETVSLTDFGDRLRRADMPVVGYISRNRFKLDLRTIFPEQDGKLIESLRGCFETQTD